MLSESLSELQKAETPCLLRAIGRTHRARGVCHPQGIVEEDCHVPEGTELAPCSNFWRSKDDGRRARARRPELDRRTDLEFVRGEEHI